MKTKNLRLKLTRLKLLLVFAAALAAITAFQTALLSAPASAEQCGKGNVTVQTKFNFGCLGNDYGSPASQLSPIMDVTFAIIRFLSYGVGLVVIASIIVAGLQYTSSEGNPEATQQAKNRIRNAIAALFVYLFSFSILQWLVPGGVFGT